MAVSQTVKPQKFSDHLELLLKLQELDNEIMDFEDERADIPTKRQRLEEAVEDARKSLEEHGHQITMIEDDIAHRNRLLELEKLKEKNTGSKAKKLEKLKDYESYLKELEENDLSAEDLIQAIENLKKRMDELNEAQVRIKNEIVELEVKRNTKYGELDIRLAELDATLDKLYDRRDDLAELVREDLFLKYEHIADSKEGIAVSPVDHGHCQICNMAIPPQMHNELMRRDRLMACPACNRILVYPAED